MQARESSFIKQKLLFLEGTKNLYFQIKTMVIATEGR